MDSLALKDRAETLLQDCVEGCTAGRQSSHTIAIYDTAWVSLVSKQIDQERRWLFPESFHLLLGKQQPDGGWESHGGSDDGLINTLAALLALKKHSLSLQSHKMIPDLDLQARIAKAISYLHDRLPRWNIDASMHVGVEFLVPALLSMLEEEQIVLDFPQKPFLMRLSEKKLSKFNPEMLYGSQKTTLLHSLEAFIGKINFDRVEHHKLFGSMMGSPSSTAAYLMNRSDWDSEAEMYLRDVIANSGGRGTGGVPSVYPSNIFEITWVRLVLRSRETLIHVENRLHRRCCLVAFQWGALELISRETLLPISKRTCRPSRVS